MDNYEKLQDDLAKAKFQIAKTINKLDDDQTFNKDDLITIVKTYSDWHPVHDPGQWLTNVLKTWERKKYLEDVNKGFAWPSKLGVLKQYRRIARIVLKVRV